MPARTRELAVARACPYAGGWPYGEACPYRLAGDGWLYAGAWPYGEPVGGGPYEADGRRGAAKGDGFAVGGANGLPSVGWSPAGVDPAAPYGPALGRTGDGAEYGAAGGSTTS